MLPVFLQLERGWFGHAFDGEAMWRTDGQHTTPGAKVSKHILFTKAVFTLVLSISLICAMTREGNVVNIYKFILSQWLSRQILLNLNGKVRVVIIIIIYNRSNSPNFKPQNFQFFLKICIYSKYFIVHLKHHIKTEIVLQLHSKMTLNKIGEP